MRANAWAWGLLLMGCGNQVTKTWALDTPGLHALIATSSEQEVLEVRSVFVPDPNSVPAEDAPALTLDGAIVFQLAIPTDVLADTRINLLNEDRRFSEAAVLEEAELQAQKISQQGAIEGDTARVPLPAAAVVTRLSLESGRFDEPASADALATINEQVAIQARVIPTCAAPSLVPLGPDPLLTSNASILHKIENVRTNDDQIVMQTPGSLVVSRRDRETGIDVGTLGGTERLPIAVVNRELGSEGVMRGLIQVGAPRFVTAFNPEAEQCSRLASHARTIPRLVSFELGPAGWIRTGTIAHTDLFTFPQGECISDLKYEEETDRVFALAAQGSIFELQTDGTLVNRNDFDREGPPKHQLILSPTLENRFVVTSDDAIWVHNGSTGAWTRKGPREDPVFTLHIEKGTRVRRGRRRDVLVRRRGRRHHDLAPG